MMVIVVLDQFPQAEEVVNQFLLEEAWLEANYFLRQKVQVHLYHRVQCMLMQEYY